MFCPKCGTELPDDSLFCLNCGHDLREAVKPASIATAAVVPAPEPLPATPAPASKEAAPPSPEEDNLTRVVIGVGIIIAVALVVGLIWLRPPSTADIAKQTAADVAKAGGTPGQQPAALETNADKDTATSTAIPTQQQPVIPQPQPQSEDIVSDEFAIKATQYAEFRFVVPDGATRVRVEGHFSASGGSGNDIEAYVLDEDNYANWQNRHAAQAHYNSGRVTQTTIRLALPPIPRSYYLVFNNRFSLFTQKTVEADIALHYLK